MKQFRYNVAAFRVADSLSIREETFEGQRHLVVPVVMLREGVLNGAFYPAAEIGKVPEAWDGRPIAVFHPEDTDGAITANSPRIIEERTIGYLFNAVFNPATTELGAEMWINLEKAEAISPRTLEIIRTNGRLEVSTGLWVDEDHVPGVYRGTRFATSVFNLVPDHLAVLPGGEGACNWAMGCGARMMMNALRGRREELEANRMLKISAGDRLKISTLKAVAGTLGVKLNEMSFDDVRWAIQKALDTLDNPGWIHFVHNVYDDWFVYEARGNNPSETGSQTTVRKLYKRGYAIDVNSGSATLTGEAQEVREETTYVPVTSGAGGPAGNAAPGGEEQTEEEGTKAMKKNELIDKLIGCKCTRWTENDRKTLEGMSEEVLDKLQVADGVGVLPTEGEKPNPPADPNRSAEQPKLPEQPPAPAQNAAADSKKPVTLEEYIREAPPEIAGVLTDAVKRRNAIKANAVKALLANKNNTFTKEQLEAKDLDELQALTSLARVEVDFSGQGGGPPVKVNESRGVPVKHHLFPQLHKTKEGAQQTA